MHEELVIVCKAEDRFGKFGTSGQDGILGNHGWHGSFKRQVSTRRGG